MCVCVCVRVFMSVCIQNIHLGHSGHTQETGDTQGTLRGHLGDTQGALRGCSGDTQGTLGRCSGDMQGTHRGHPPDFIPQSIFDLSNSESSLTLHINTNLAEKLELHAKHLFRYGRDNVHTCEE